MATTGDIVKELQELVRLTEVANNLQQATHAILMAQSGVSGGTGGGKTPAGQSNPLGNRPNASVSSKGFFGRAWGKIKARAQAGAKAGQRIGKVTGGGKTLGAVGGAIGGVAGVFGVITGAVMGAASAVDSWTNKTFESARKLAEVSGSMAAVMAERDIGQMRRDMKRGNETAGTARDLMESESRRKDSGNRIDIVVDNVTNKIGSFFNDVIGTVNDGVADILEFFTGEEDKKSPPKGLAGDMADMMDRAREIDKAGEDMMERARRAAGTIAPAGAAPLGTLPRP